MLSDSDLDHDLLIQYLVETLPCSECGAAYHAHDVLIVEREADAWSVVVLCPECGVESMVKAYVDDSLEGVILPPDEIELIDWRRFLARFDGDLRDLLLYG